MRLQLLAVLSVISVAASCSPKKVNLTEVPVPQASNEVKVSPPSPSESPNKYFSDVQILVETKPEETCADSNKIVEVSTLPFRASLNEMNEILSEPKDLFKSFVVNVTLEIIGFDSGKYTFTAPDGMIPARVPFQMKLRRTPGNVLELRYLDQVVPMKLLTTPIYTFTATETRGDCKIAHHVNVFSERAGYFKKAQR